MNNKSLLVLIACLWLGMFAQSANAKGPNYSYAELGITAADRDDVDGLGVTAVISYAALDIVHIKMAYSRLFLDGDIVAMPGSDLEVDVDRFIIGIGGNYSITDNIDALVTVSYVDEELSGDVPTTSEDGYQVDAGIRAMLSKKLELNGGATTTYIGSDSDTGVAAGAVYKLDRRYALTGNVRFMFDENEPEYFAGVRLNF